MPIDTDIFQDDPDSETTVQQSAAFETVYTGEAGSTHKPELPSDTKPTEPGDLAPKPAESTPFMGWGAKAKTTNGIMALIGGVLVAGVSAFFLTSGSKKPSPTAMNGTQPPAATRVDVPPPPQNTPTNDVPPPPVAASTQLTPNEILGTKTGTSTLGKSGRTSGVGGSHTIQVGDNSSSEPLYGGSSAALANVSSFPGGNGHFQVPPPGSGYQPAESGGFVSTSGGAAPKPSLVFTRKGTELDKVNSATNFPLVHSSNFGLPVGYKVAVRLESVATTAIKSPVIAVVEYNVEKDGQVIIPAGSKFIGTISEADRNGSIGFQFSRLLQHDGTGTNIAAIAVDKNMAALKGDVTGKNTGKKILVGIAQGLGTASAVVVGGGAGSITQPYSESDAIRQQVAQNAGTTGNNAIQSLSQSERIVVTLPAGTEFYAEFVDAGKTNQ